jgi:hypothetical protein
MDLLMAYINSHPEFGMHVFYSTPSIYVDAGISLVLNVSNSLRCQKTC